MKWLLHHAGSGGKVYRGIGRHKFAQHLQAGSARRTGCAVQICNRHGNDFAVASVFGDGPDQRRPFGTDREAVGDIFDIAAG